MARRGLALSVLLALGACQEDGSLTAIPLPDFGADGSDAPDDARPRDARAADTRPISPDGSPSMLDAARPDAISPDAVPPDAMPPDAMPPDAMPPDAVPADAARPDALVMPGPDALIPPRPDAVLDAGPDDARPDDAFLPPEPDVFVPPEPDVFVPPEPDVFVPPEPDAEPDAALDAEPDAALDAEPDAAPDAAPIPDAAPPDAVPTPDVFFAPDADVPPDEIDRDDDGITDVIEMRIGTDPRNIDSDFDGLTDFEELGDPNQPIDADLDGIINALESRRADQDSDGVDDPFDAFNQPVDRFQLTGGRFVPFAIGNDGEDETRLEIRITGGVGITRVEVSRADSGPIGGFPSVRFWVDDVEVNGDGFDLFDDATHGDRTAGDGIWTRGGITSTTRPHRAFARIMSHKFDQVTITDAAGTLSRNVWDGYQRRQPVLGLEPFILGVVDAAQIAEPERVGATAQVTEHLVNLVAPAPSIGVKRFLYGGDRRSLQNLTRAFYEVFPDDYDFLFFWPESPAFSGAAGFAEALQNDAEGTGLRIFNFAPLNGSAGRLQHLVGLNFADNGPILHEAMHRWAVYLPSMFGFFDIHWGYSSVDGQLGGFELDTMVNLGNNQVTMDRFGLTGNGGDGRGYGALELYLMGCLPAAQVPDITVLRNPVLAGSSDGNPILRYQALETVTIDDIIAAEGPRIPAFGDAPSVYRAAFVVASQRWLTVSEMAFFESQADLFGRSEGDGQIMSFEEATGGCARMETRIRLDD